MLEIVHFDQAAREIGCALDNNAIDGVQCLSGRKYFDG